MELRVAIRIFDDREQKHLSHILSLASKRGEVPILTAPAASADVIFIKNGEPGASVFLQQGRARKLPIAVLYDDIQTDYSWILRRPATSTALIPLMKDLQQAVALLQREALINPASTEPYPSIEKTKITAPPTLIPTISGQALLDRLCGRDGRNVIWCVQLDLNSYFVIDAKNHVVYVPVRYMDMPVALLDILMMFRNSDFVEINDAELASILVRDGVMHMTKIPCEQFAWMACQYAEPQLPISDSAINTQFRLQRWPSFTRLNHTSRHMQWSGRLMKGAASLAQLTVGAVDDLVDAAKFYNACMVGGLATVVAAGDSASLEHETEKNDSEKSGLFQRILKRLRR